MLLKKKLESEKSGEKSFEEIEENINFKEGRRSKKRKGSILKSKNGLKSRIEESQDEIEKSQKSVNFNKNVVVKKFRVNGKPKNLFFES